MFVNVQRHQNSLFFFFFFFLHACNVQWRTMAPKERRGELRSGTNKASQTTRHPQWIRKGRKEGKKEKRRKKKKVISKIILSQSPYLTPKPASQNHWQPESPQVKPQSSQIAMRIQDGGNRGGGKNMADYDAALAAGSGRRSG